MYSKRLQTEYKHILDNPIDGIQLEPDELSLLDWNCVIDGPKESPFEGGKFKVHLELPTTYPFQPPKAYFVTQIFHPNIHFETGEVCLDVLKSNWQPIWGVASVCVAIQLLLSNPEPSSPLNCDAGNLLRSGDEIAYNSLARLITKEQFFLGN